MSPRSATPSTLPSAKRLAYIDAIVSNAAAEANAYPDLVNLLTDPRCGIGLRRDRVVVDTRLTTGARPDLQLWLDVPESLRAEAMHLYGVVEAKPRDLVVVNGAKIAAEKFAIYQTTGLRHFWLHDAEVVQRYDLNGSNVLPIPQTWTWNELRLDRKFEEAFLPLTGAFATLQTQLADFERDGTSVKRISTDGENRGRFIESVLRVARLLNDAVRTCVETELKPALQQANSLSRTMTSTYGEASFDWNNLEEPITFNDAPMGGANRRLFERTYVALLDDLEPYMYALRAEHETLGAYALRTGISGKVSFLGSSKNDKRAVEVFVQETASLLLSRLLMIRFSEDHGLLSRYISNGGISAFATYAAHLRRPYQALVREAYRNAQPIYRHLFSEKTLDWIIASERADLSQMLLHALWILAHWNLTTVRGDILSGVYDRYLEPVQKRALGEIYTRPEIARYLIDRSGWDRSKTILDPACGTGTFLVEAFEAARAKAISGGFGFDETDALDVIWKLHGLDVNEFSATLAKIQILWHVLSAGGAGSIKEIIRSLSIEGGQSSLETWGMTMASAGTLGLGIEPNPLLMRQRRDVSAFRALSTNEHAYDVVAGNPPYVSVKNVQISAKLLDEYSDVAAGQTDLAALFVYRALEWWLKPGGTLAFIVNFALANTGATTKLRETLRRYKIVELINFEDLGQALFDGISVVAMGMIIEKVPASDDDVVTITTVTQSCINPVTKEIDMSRARRVDILRRFINLDHYVTPTPGDEDDDDNSLANNSILLTVAPNDVPVLEKLSAGDRLENLLRAGYRKRSGATFVHSYSAPPAHDPAWHRVKVQGFGVETGGSATGTRSIYGAASIYPDRHEGSIEGTWDGSLRSVVNARFYRWNIAGIDFSRVYALRKVSLIPQAGPHDPRIFFRNSCTILHLADDFPLNYYLLSRIPQWFALKLLRSSVVQGYYGTWVPSMLYRIPVPAESQRTAALYAEIRAIGKRLSLAQSASRTRAARLEAFLVPSSGYAQPLRSSGSSVMLPPVSDFFRRDTTVDDVNVSLTANDLKLEVRNVLIQPTLSGNPTTIRIPDKRVREWLAEITALAIKLGRLPDHSFFRDVPLPASIPTALAEMRRTLAEDSIKDYDVALRELDAVIAAALCLTDAERCLVVSEMSTDPILLRLRPTWY